MEKASGRHLASHLLIGLSRSTSGWPWLLAYFASFSSFNASSLDSPFGKSLLVDAIYVKLYHRYCVVLAMWSYEAEATGAVYTIFVLHTWIVT